MITRLFLDRYGCFLLRSCNFKIENMQSLNMADFEIEDFNTLRLFDLHFCLRINLFRTNTESESLHFNKK